MRLFATEESCKVKMVASLSALVIVTCLILKTSVTKDSFGFGNSHGNHYRLKHRKPYQFQVAPNDAIKVMVTALED